MNFDRLIFRMRHRYQEMVSPPLVLCCRHQSPSLAREHVLRLIEGSSAGSQDLMVFITSQSWCDFFSVAHAVFASSSVIGAERTLFSFCAPGASEPQSGGRDRKFGARNAPGRKLPNVRSRVTPVFQIPNNSLSFGPARGTSRVREI
jgi:hypothetical protein